jgi:8-oxo-dGTP diphosphatase
MREYARNVIVVFCYVVRDGQVLLIERGKPPHRGEYTVIGGKKEAGEDLAAACRREVMEESGLAVRDLKLRGLVSIAGSDPLRADYDVLAAYFLTSDFTGVPSAQNEGEVEWCPVEDSFRKPGISEYYVKISPLVLGDGDFFLAHITTEGAAIKDFVLTS